MNKIIKPSGRIAVFLMGMFILSSMCAMVYDDRIHRLLAAINKEMLTVKDIEKIHSIVEKENADINVPYNNSKTLLRRAIEYGNSHVDIIVYLVKCGALVRQHDNMFITCDRSDIFVRHCLQFLAAVKEGNVDLAKSILNQDPDVANARDEGLKGAIFYAVQNNNRDFVKYLVSLGTSIYQDDEKAFNNGAAGYLQKCKKFLDYAKNGGIDYAQYCFDNDPSIINARDERGRGAIFYAVQHNQGAFVEKLIKAGAHICEVDGGTSSTDASKLVKKYLEYFAAVASNRVDYVSKHNDLAMQLFEHGMTALHIAARAGAINVVKYLVETCKVNVQVEDACGMTALHRAACGGSSIVFKYLAERCSLEPGMKNGLDKQLLRLAISNNNLTICRYLVERGVVITQDLVETSQYQNRAAEYIENCVKLDNGLLYPNNFHIFEDFIKEHRETLNMHFEDGATVLSLAIDFDSIEALRIIMRYGAGIGGDDSYSKVKTGGEIEKYLNDVWLPLFNGKSGAFKDIDSLKKLIKKYPEITYARYSDGSTLLHAVARFGKPDMVIYLVEQKDMDINVRNKGGLSPILCAIQAERLDMVKKFIDLGILTDDAWLEKITDKNSSNYVNTYKQLCTKIENSELLSQENIDFIRANRELVNAYCEGGKTMASLAIASNNLQNLKALISCGAKIDDNALQVSQGDVKNYFAEILPFFPKTEQSLKNDFIDNFEELITKYPELVYVRFDDGSTVLHRAAIKGDLTLVKLLLEKYKLDVNARDNAGKTPLYWVVEGGANVEVITKYLVEHGKADITIPDKMGITVFNCAACHLQCTGIVKYLVDQHKVDVEEPNKQGETALDFAIKSNNCVGTRALFERGAKIGDNVGYNPGYSYYQFLKYEKVQPIASLVSSIFSGVFGYTFVNEKKKGFDRYSAAKLFGLGCAITAFSYLENICSYNRHPNKSNIEVKTIALLDQCEPKILAGFAGVAAGLLRQKVSSLTGVAKK